MAIDARTEVQQVLSATRKALMDNANIGVPGIHAIHGNDVKRMHDIRKSSCGLFLVLYWQTHEGEYRTQGVWPGTEAMQQLVDAVAQYSNEE